jgi:hypothetical protein
VAAFWKWGKGNFFYAFGHMNRNCPFISRTACLVLAFFAVVDFAEAQFNYNSGDVLVCFRNTASPRNDMIVDAGSVSTFTNLTIGQKITISYTGAQLANVGTNNIAWCACAANYNFPTSDNTWITRPRTSLNSQTTPWTTGTPGFMSPVAGDIDGNPSLGADATYISGAILDTATVIVETESGHTTANEASGDCYSFWIGAANSSGIGNFNGDFQGVVEQTTPAGFTTGGQPVRADFYQLLSKSGTVNGTPGTYLGYFEFSTNGVMTYTAGPSPLVVPPPTITAISSFETTNTITFTTVNGGTYNLIGTNILTAARTNWPVLGSSILGDGNPKSLTDVTTNSQRFYSISAH